MIEPPTSTPIQMQSLSSKLPLILAGLIFMLAAGTGGVYLGKYLYGPKAPQISTSVTPTPRAEAPTATPVLDSMVGWKTYRNNNLGIEFRHPPFLNDSCCIAYSDSLYNMDKVVTLAEKLDTGFEGGAEVYNGLTISISSNTTKQSLEEFVEVQKHRNLQPFYSKDQIEQYINRMETKRVDLDGLTGIQIIWFPVLNSDIIYMPVKNQKFFIAIQKSEEHDIEFNTTFDQILSTFRFLEP